MRLKSPFLKKLELRGLPEPDAYPFTAAFCRYWAEPLEFDSPITILTGVNGSGKSTFLEALAAAIGFDMAGGGVGYLPADHSTTLEITGAALGNYLKLTWRPKVGTGWFFRAETFHRVANYLDEAALSEGKPPPDYLNVSHGEGFMEFFETRLKYRGMFLLDEPESAISPSRQADLVRVLKEAASAGRGQFFIATHSPIIMAAGDGPVLDFHHRGVTKKSFRETAGFQSYYRFFHPEEDEL
jgi:predicted ATPase